MVIFHGKLLVYQRVTIQTGIHVRSVRSKYLGSTVIWWISAFVWFMWKECTFDFWISVIFMDVTRALTHLQQTTLAFESRVAKSFSKNIWNPFRGHNSASWHHMSLPFSSRTFWDHIPQKHRSPAADGRHPGHLPFPAISSSAFRLPQAAAAGCWAVSARTCHGLGWRQGKNSLKIAGRAPKFDGWSSWSSFSLWKWQFGRALHRNLLPRAFQGPNRLTHRLMPTAGWQTSIMIPADLLLIWVTVIVKDIVKDQQTKCWRWWWTSPASRMAVTVIIMIADSKPNKEVP